MEEFHPPELAGADVAVGERLSIEESFGGPAIFHQLPSQSRCAGSFTFDHPASLGEHTFDYHSDFELKA
jgi:hypothetical protein